LASARGLPVLGGFIDGVRSGTCNSRDALTGLRNGVGALQPGDVGDVALQ
jgi:hypothetical protein